MPRLSFFALFGASLLVAIAAAQAPSNANLHLVAVQGSGTVSVPLHGDWQPSGLKLYDNGTRPSVELKGKTPGIMMSVLLFPTGSVAPNAEACREDVLQPLLKRFTDVIDKKSITRGELTSDSGGHLATITYSLAATPGEIASATGISLRQQNNFAFYGDKNICAEIHISQMLDKDTKPATFDAEMKRFTPDGSYTPVALDYASLGSIFYRNMKDYASAALYYQRALDTLPVPNSPERLSFFRFITDQLAMSYGIAGDIKRSRAVNEAAIAKDPDYPLYYYNLACADAESGNASAAQTHLKEAFDRRANTLPGEKLPDPAQDDSIQKLKKNKDFWAFVQALPKG
jgi:tetratricopeptide (TPR) repeat protein